MMWSLMTKTKTQNPKHKTQNPKTRKPESKLNSRHNLKALKESLKT